MDFILPLIQQLNQPLQPQPTEVEPLLQELPGIRAVVFDIYGTLIISGSGDISLAQANDRDELFRQAFAAADLPLPDAHLSVSEHFFEAVSASHEASKAQGIEYPEVEIRGIWKKLLVSLDYPNHYITETNVVKLAIEYECRSNPVWPMPHLWPTLEAIASAGLAMGIVSNAQFYTPFMFPAFGGRSLSQLGFDPDLCIWSYLERQGKPSTALYLRLDEQLRKQGIEPHEVLYVGNDMRNDVWPAQLCGLKTALFAGDARSLRWRKDDDRITSVRPDLILTSLSQLAPLLIY